MADVKAMLKASACMIANYDKCTKANTAIEEGGSSVYRSETGRRAIVLGLAFVLAACASPRPATVQVHVGDETVSAYRDNANSSVSIVSSAPGRSDVSSSFTYDTLPGVRFMAFKGSGASLYDTYTFGVAPPGATRVDIDAGMAASAVAIDGTFVVVTQGDQPGRPLDFHWSFLSASGAVIAEGQGTRP